MIKFLLTLCLCMLFAFSAAAQTTLTGKVSASDEEGPLPGVAIQIDGTARGVATDFDGNFKISLSENDSVLIFSYIGYAKKRINVLGITTLNVVLDPEF